jgi:hypothetical protein
MTAGSITGTRARKPALTPARGGSGSGGWAGRLALATTATLVLAGVTGCGETESETRAAAAATSSALSGFTGDLTLNGVAMEQEAVAAAAVGAARVAAEAEAARIAAEQAAAAEAARLAAEQAAAAQAAAPRQSGGGSTSGGTSRTAPARGPAPAPAPAPGGQPVDSWVNLEVASCSFDGASYTSVFAVIFSDGHRFSGLRYTSDSPRMYNLYMDYGGQSMFTVSPADQEWPC